MHQNMKILLANVFFVEIIISIALVSKLLCSSLVSSTNLIESFKVTQFHHVVKGKTLFQKQSNISSAFFDYQLGICNAFT